MCPVRLVTQKHSLAVLSIFLVLDKEVAITSSILHEKSNAQNQILLLQFVLPEQIGNVKG